MPLGGGTSAQKKYGIEDSPDLLFRDLTDWSVVEPNGFPDYRYNDREIIRAFADNSAATYEWLVAHGVIFIDKAPDDAGGNCGRQLGAAGDALRGHGLADGADRQAGRSRPSRRPLSSGNGLMRPLEAAARKAGVRDPARAPHDRRSTAKDRMPAACSASRWTTTARRLNIRARKAVIIATGGSTGNVNFRRMFDPRLTEEYCGLAGMPWSDQDASGEIAAMAIGASLWGLYNQTGEFGSNLTKPGTIGCQYGYAEPAWFPGSAVFDKARATGPARRRLAGRRSWSTCSGKRFYDETGGPVHRQQLRLDRSLRARQLSQREEHQVRPAQLAQCGAGRHRRRP